MDQSDIIYILDLLKDATTSNDWDIVEEAKDILKEFLDSEEFQNNE